MRSAFRSVSSSWVEGDVVGWVSELKRASFCWVKVRRLSKKVVMRAWLYSVRATILWTSRMLEGRELAEVSSFSWVWETVDWGDLVVR